MDVLHFELQKCQCSCCGKTVKAKIPHEYETGYGPRLSAFIAERSVIPGDSRESVQSFCASVLNFPISIGAIQRVVDRSSSEHINQFGHAVLKELRLLCHWAKSPPSDNQWTAFYTRFIQLITDHEKSKDDAGKLSRALIREMITLWVFLEEQGVEPTNNRAERALRAGVLWRKRSKGTQSDKGDRWVERILSLKQTCRMRSIPTFNILVEAIDSFFKEREPDLTWLG
jgi:hypothetical protein